MLVIARILSLIISFILGTTIYRLDISTFHKFMLFLLIILEMFIIAFICYHTYIGG